MSGELANKFLPYAVVTTQFYFWIYLTVILMWRRRTGGLASWTKTEVEIATKVTVLIFTMVLFLQAASLILEISVSIDYQFIYMIIEKVAEGTSSVIMCYFIMDIQPVLVLLERWDSIEKQTNRINLLKKSHLVIMVIAIVNGLVLVISRSYSYILEGVDAKVRPEAFVTATIKFVIDVGVILVALRSLSRLKEIRRKKKKGWN